MLPGGIAAAAFVLSLIPGWWFLRRTESSRRPRQLSALQEVLELVGVGLLTTGAATAVGFLAAPGVLLLDREFPAQSTGELRTQVALTVAVFIAAVLLAEGLAAVVRKLDPAPGSEFRIGVWWSVLNRKGTPEGSVPWVAVALTDESTVEGVMAEYTWSADATHRDIGLIAPIQITSGGVLKQTPYERLIVPAEQIRHIALTYAPDPGQQQRAVTR